MTRFVTLVQVAVDTRSINSGNSTTTILLRAERAGSGPGRVYTIAGTLLDAAGNPNAVCHDRDGPTRPVERHAALTHQADSQTSDGMAAGQAAADS